MGIKSKNKAINHQEETKTKPPSDKSRYNMMIRPTAAALLLVLAAASVDTIAAISPNPMWTSSTSLIQSQAAPTSEDTLGELCVDDEGNFFSPRLACPQAQSTAVRRGGCDGGSSIKTSPKNRSVPRRRNESNTKKAT